LKLLPPEDIEHLEFPSEQASDSPVRSVLYAVLESRQEVGGNATTSKQLEMESQNFNLFTGNQTLQERQESFKVISCLQIPDISEIFVGAQMFELWPNIAFDSTVCYVNNLFRMLGWMHETLTDCESDVLNCYMVCHMHN